MAHRQASPRCQRNLFEAVNHLQELAGGFAQWPGGELGTVQPRSIDGLQLALGENLGQGPGLAMPQGSQPCTRIGGIELPCDIRRGLSMPDELKTHSRVLPSP
jgi:hypothetical protein